MMVRAPARLPTCGTAGLVPTGVAGRGRRWIGGIWTPVATAMTRMNEKRGGILLMKRVAATGMFKMNTTHATNAEVFTGWLHSDGLDTLHNRTQLVDVTIIPVDPEPVRFEHWGVLDEHVVQLTAKDVGTFGPLF